MPDFLPSLSSRLITLSAHITPTSDPSTSAVARKETDKLAALTSEVRSHINTLFAFASNYSNVALATARKEEDWDKKGTELWNLCARLNRHDSNDYERGVSHMGLKNQNASTSPSLASLLALARLLAFLFLDYGFKSTSHTRRKMGNDRGATAQAQKSSELSKVVRLLKVANKAARSCLMQRHTELASKVLERAAEYEDAMGRAGASTDHCLEGNAPDVEQEDDRRMFARLRADYLGLRIMLVCFP